MRASSAASLILFAALVALLACVCVAQALPPGQNVTVWNSKLWVGQQEFFVKGVDYSPSPLGYSPLNASAATGFCSWRDQIFGGTTNCYDSDFWDSTPWPQNKSVNGFEPLWLRDFPIMKSYNVNVIRLYNANPSTQAAVNAYQHLAGNAGHLSRNHTLFMDLAYQFDIKVAFPLFFYDQDWSVAAVAIAVYQRFLRWQIDEIGNHPALLWWHFGNEQDWTANGSPMNKSPFWVTKYNNFVDYIKRYTFSKWNRYLPVTYSLNNNQPLEAFYFQNLHWDFASMNMFTTADSDFQDMFFYGNDSSHDNFTAFSSAICRYMKPFIITEYYPSHLPQWPYQPYQLNLLWYNIMNLYESGMLGGFYFEHSDEPSDVLTNSHNGKLNGVIGLNMSGTSQSGSLSVNNFTPDLWYYKQQYSDITTGIAVTHNNVLANYRNDITKWPSVNRALWTSFSQSIDRCAARYGTTAVCPGTQAGSPVCSGNGMCDRLTQQCSCGTGWTGAACNIPVCNCQNNGICSTVISPPECLCPPPYYGPNCTAVTVPGQCPGVGDSTATYPSCTYGNGWCNATSNYKCVCIAGWVGLDCAVTDVNFNYALSTSSTIGITTSTSFGTSTSLASATSISTSKATSTTAATSISIASTTSTSAASISASTTSAASTASVSSTISIASTTSTQTLQASTYTSTLASTTASTSSTSSTTSKARTSSTSTSTTGLSTTAAPTTVVQTTPAPTTVVPTTIVSTTPAPSTNSISTSPPSTRVPTTSIVTTQAPTTAQPTSISPSTVAPTTNVPTTATPSTVIPSTVVPSTVVPSTLAPTTVVPSTAAPTTQIPTTAVPVSESTSSSGSSSSSTGATLASSSSTTHSAVNVAVRSILHQIFILMVIIIAVSLN